MKRIVLDIETNTKHDKIWLVVTKDIDTGELRTWKEASHLSEYLRDVSSIVGHNVIAFDAPTLNRCWKTKITRKQCWDTLVVSRLLDPSKESGHSLEAWGEELKTQKLDYRAVWLWMKNLSHKEVAAGQEFNEPIMSLLEHYCIKDVEVTERLFHHLQKKLKKENFSDYSVELEHKVAAIIAQQERNGFRLDLPYATELLANIQGKLDRIYESMQERWPAYDRERISEKTGKTLKPERVVFNPGSRQQIAEKLIELGWKPDKYTEKGSVIVDETVLMSVDIPEAKMIAEYLLLQKRISQIKQWLEAVKDDGRVHGRVITNGAVTGRMTHSSPNMAQIPNAGSVYGHECRECWTVDAGNVLVGCDASGLELRMLAHYMKDEGYVRTVTEGSSKDGTDVHTVNQRAAGLPTRDAAKTFIYAFLYGAGDAKIGSIVGGSTTDGKRLKDKFLRQTPALKKLIERVATIASKGYVPGLDGRKIWVRSEHAALNSLLQGAGAIVMKQALVMFDDKVRANKWKVKYVANVHDEAQLECAPDIAEAVGQTFRQSIIDAGKFFNLRCPLDGEYKIGRNWKETH
jgi:DNA polymerase I